MAKTEKAKRAARKKVLTRRLKEQKRNARKTLNRTIKIEKELWELKLERIKEEGILSSLTWRYTSCVPHYKCGAIISKETTKNHPGVAKLQKWLRQQTEEEYIMFFRNAPFLMCMSFLFDDDDGFDDRDPMTIVILSVYEGIFEDRVIEERKMLDRFADEWRIKIDDTAPL